MVDSRPTPDSSVPAVLRAFLRERSVRKLVVACSGGSDSVSLVLCLDELRKELGLSVTIVHVNHRLRGKESEADQSFVTALGRRLKIPVRTVQCPIRRGGGNIEEQARDTRYAALFKAARKAAAPWVLTGHTQDDQAETVLMNILRGCGPDGIAGIPPARTDEATGTGIGRPWLPLTRTALRSFLADRKEPFRNDSSNDDLSILRNYLRVKVFKDLETRASGFQGRVARLADLMRGEQVVWALWIDEAWKRLARPHRGGALVNRLDLDALSLGFQRRFLRRAAGRDLLTFDGVERLRLWMQSAPSSGRTLQLRKGWIVERLSKTGGSPSAFFFWFHGPHSQPRSRIDRLKKRTKIHG